jgi:hypothetical protein
MLTTSVLEIARFFKKRLNSTRIESRCIAQIARTPASFENSVLLVASEEKARGGRIKCRVCRGNAADAFYCIHLAFFLMPPLTN